MAEGFYFVRPTTASATSLLRGDDDIWREADRITWGPAAYRTSFRAFWTADGLYLRFDASESPTGSPSFHVPASFQGFVFV